MGLFYLLAAVGAALVFIDRKDEEVKEEEKEVA